jgi:hypothetical protein
MPMFSDGFEDWWSNYPRKQKKGDARKAWNSIKPTPAMLNAMKDALTWQKRTRQWTKDGGEFVPLPATYLRAEQWTDEPFHAPRTIVPAAQDGARELQRMREDAQRRRDARLEEPR